ncbi:MAG: hypothetical protein MJZ41_10785 [Bacteroidaceae bacterium]|nr:hypothetical protein [Bacteroidaceae bacterium]
MGLIDFLRSLFGASNSDSSQQETDNTPQAPQPETHADAVEGDTEITNTYNKNLQKPDAMKTSELMLKFLKEQGFLPETLDNGNILFKYQMSSFLYIENDEDESFFQLCMPSIFNVTEDNREAALIAANAVSSCMKVAKAVVFEDDVWLITECLLDSTPVLEDLVPRFLNILMSAQKEFYDKIN